jgi:protein FrlC
VITLADAQKIFSEIDHPNLKIMLDTCAMGVACETIQQWFDAFGDNIIHTHFVDGTPYGHLIWGDGNRPLGEYLQALQVNGYTGYLGQEITDFKYFRDPASHDRRNMQAFEAYLDG